MKPWLRVEAALPSDGPGAPSQVRIGPPLLPLLGSPGRRWIEPGEAELDSGSRTGVQTGFEPVRSSQVLSKIQPFGRSLKSNPKPFFI